MYDDSIGLPRDPIAAAIRKTLKASLRNVDANICNRPTQTMAANCHRSSDHVDIRDPLSMDMTDL